MKPIKFISAIISYLLIFQLLPIPEASCALSCIKEVEVQKEITVDEPLGADHLSAELFTPPPMSAIARW